MSDFWILVLKNGIWATLFVGLLLFVLKDSGEREKKYQKTISELTEHLGVVREIKNQVDDIENTLKDYKKSES